MKKINSKKRVVVAMSGGVDSSVAAALLKKQGYFVIGVFMKLCRSTESEKMARLVSNKLDIPFYVLNVEKEFKKKVVDYFLKEYKKGNTPNPCVVCNKEIKFGLLVEKAFKMGADFIATGHYARVSRGNQIFSAAQPLFQGIPSPRKNLLPRSILLKAKDKNKDQSYFLWQLSQKQLAKVLFPVGNYTKSQVRALAKKFNLPTAETPESQEVCFIENATNEFLEKYLKTKSGQIVEIEDVRHPKALGCRTSQKILGAHKGLWFYTIGQRKGIGLSGGPYYVVAKDFKKNNLIVSKNKKDLLQKELMLKNVSWISEKTPKLPMKVKVRIRYRAKEADSIIYKLPAYRTGRQTTNYKLKFTKPQPAVTPGQSAVFYEGDELLGGGIIDR